MDLTFLKYNFKSQMNSIKWNWREILFGLDNNIIRNEDAISYAIYIFDNGIVGYDYVLEMTTLRSEESAKPYVRKLIVLEPEKNESEIKDKWLHAILRWLYDKRKEINNSLDIVEEIYMQFGYPDSIVNFVRYMPSESEDLGSVELNRKRLFKNWERYLEEYKEKNYIP